jgi:hypothetical protein
MVVTRPSSGLIFAVLPLYKRIRPGVRPAVQIRPRRYGFQSTEKHGESTVKPKRRYGLRNWGIGLLVLVLRPARRLVRLRSNAIYIGAVASLGGGTNKRETLTKRRNNKLQEVVSTAQIARHMPGSLKNTSTESHASHIQQSHTKKKARHKGSSWHSPPKIPMG